MRKLIPCAMSFMLMFAAPVMAQTVDESAISELLHTTFDRPEAPHKAIWEAARFSAGNSKIEF